MALIDISKIKTRTSGDISASSDFHSSSYIQLSPMSDGIGAYREVIADSMGYIIREAVSKMYDDIVGCLYWDTSLFSGKDGFKQSQFVDYISKYASFKSIAFHVDEEKPDYPFRPSFYKEAVMFALGEMGVSSQFTEDEVEGICDNLSKCIDSTYLEDNIYNTYEEKYGGRITPIVIVRDDSTSNGFNLIDFSSVPKDDWDDFDIELSRKMLLLRSAILYMAENFPARPDSLSSFEQEVADYHNSMVEYSRGKLPHIWRDVDIREPLRVLLNKSEDYIKERIVNSENDLNNLKSDFTSIEPSMAFMESVSVPFKLDDECRMISSGVTSEGGITFTEQIVGLCRSYSNLFRSAYSADGDSDYYITFEVNGNKYKVKNPAMSMCVNLFLGLPRHGGGLLDKDTTLAKSNLDLKFAYF